ncbi:MAG: hypothetical protein ACYC2K_07375 [Gemmatimonadales bacterium]
MSKELYMKAHEELIEEAMEADPTLDWSTAYTITAAGAHQRMVDKIANAADEAKDRAKYER